MKRQLFFVIFNLMCLQLTMAQVVTEQLDSYMLKVREGAFDPVPVTILDSEESSLFTSLAQYSKDSIPKIRSKANFIAKTIGQKSDKSKIREMAIDQLILYHELSTSSVAFPKNRSEKLLAVFDETLKKFIPKQ